MQQAARDDRNLQERLRATRSPAVSWLPAVLAAVLTITPEFDFQGIPKVRFTDLLLPLLLISCVSSEASTNQRKPGIPLLPIMYLILAWDLGVLMLGDCPLRPGIFYLGKRAAFFLIYAFGVRVGRSEDGQVQISRVIRALVFSAPALALSVMVEQGLHADNTEFRASGIIRDQEASTAFFLVFVIGVNLGVWQALSRSLDRVGIVASLAFAIRTLFATGTRGGLILFVIVAGIILPKSARSFVPLALLLALLGLAGWAYTPVGVQNRLGQLTDETRTAWTGVTDGADSIASKTGGSSTADRLVAADRALKYLVLQSPIVGYGAGYKKLGFVDNMYVTELVYDGSVGLLLWLYFQVGVGLHLRRAERKLTDPVSRGAAVGLFAIWVAFSVGCFTADMFYLIRPAEGFFLLAGIVTGALQRVECECARDTSRTESR